MLRCEAGTGGRCAVLRGGSVTITIYHNPACGTSRNVLALIRNSGEEPHVIEYLKTPPSRGELAALIGRMGIAVRDLLRREGTPYDALGLDDPALNDTALIDAMMAHPILINRPIVVTDKGAKLCRPSETVLNILPGPQRGAFSKEDGAAVVDAGGNRVASPAP
jgi:arsenate reductase